MNWHKKSSIVALLVLILGCSVKLPIDEIATAKASLEAAREQRAQVYAPEEYKAAEQSLRQAEKDMGNEEYDWALRLAKFSAIQSKYAKSIAQWKGKAEEMKKAQGELNSLRSEAEQAQKAAEEIKAQIH